MQRTHPSRIVWPAFAGFYAAIAFPSMAIFKKVGPEALAAYLVLAAIALLIATRWIGPWLSPGLDRRTAAVAVAVVVLVLGGFYAWAHPIIDTAGFELAGRSFGAADADDGIDQAIADILAGRYPYYSTSFLGNPLTPLPGALVLAYPFYLLGDSGLQNIFWIAAFLAGLAWWTGGSRLSLLVAVATFALSPNAIYHVACGTDYIANGIYVFVFSALLVESTARGKPFALSAAFAVLLGIGLSSRLNFMLVLPPAGLALWRCAGFGRAATLLATAGAAMLAITLPFYLHDPAGFSPFHTANALSQGNLYAWAPVVIPLAATALAVIRNALRKGYTLEGFASDVFLGQAVLVLGGMVLASLTKGFFDLSYAHYGMLFLFPGLFAYAALVFPTAAAHDQNGIEKPQPIR